MLIKVLLLQSSIGLLVTMSELSVKDFEKSLLKLEEIVKKMEQNEMPLDQALTSFKEGIELVQKCEQTITESKQTVDGLIEKLDQQSEEEE